MAPSWRRASRHPQAQGSHFAVVGKRSASSYRSRVLVSHNHRYRERPKAHMMHCSTLAPSMNEKQPAHDAILKGACSMSGSEQRDDLAKYDDRVLGAVMYDSVVGKCGPNSAFMSARASRGKTMIFEKFCKHVPRHNRSPLSQFPHG